MLLERAAQFGLDPAQIARLEQPILVRGLDNDLDEAAMAVKSREYNQTMTQSLQREAEGISRGRLISPEPFAKLAAGLDVSRDLTETLRPVNQAALANRELSVWLGQTEMVNSNQFKSDPVIQALALTLRRANAGEVKARFGIWADEVRRNAGSQGNLLGSAAKSADEMFATAFFKPAASVDGFNFAGFDPAKKVACR